ncbi:MAG TPA: hypothetical protein VJB14_05065 [Planctomycetota bacterium]|nr:hypothetical protein [Planctomycetota bacterium]
MSLSDGPTFEALRTKFVCGWRDIKGEPWSGVSGRYDPDHNAAWTTNGAGPHNIQLFMLSADGTVLHCLPGYWETHDLAHEIKLAEELDAVWTDGALSREEKDKRFREKHLQHLKDHPKEMVARSAMQGFDKKFEEKRKAVSDCFAQDGSPKTTDRIMHERMSTRPFVAFEKFDVQKYTDYGRQKYDKKRVLTESAVKS